VFKKGREFGFRGVELRGIRGEMDLTKLPEFAATRQKATMRQARDSGLRILNLCASTTLHNSDGSKLRSQMDEARRFIDLAHQLGVPYVRVFPGAASAGEQHDSVVREIAMNLGKLGDYAKGSGITVLLESHPGFSDSKTLSDILVAAAAGPDIGVLWDTGHTFGEAREQPSETYRRLKPYVRLAQFVDFVIEGNKIRYVLLGEGDVPVREAVRTLVHGNYHGYYSFDWPKLWRRDIAEPEVAFPHFVTKMREYLASV
jgi:sugar phosphate isomerase/epimerase